MPDPESPGGGPTNLLPHIQKNFDARKTCEYRIWIHPSLRSSFQSFLLLTDPYLVNAVRKAILGMMAMKRMSSLAQQLDPNAENLSQNLAKYKEESEKEVMEVCSFSNIRAWISLTVKPGCGGIASPQCRQRELTSLVYTIDSLAIV